MKKVYLLLFTLIIFISCSKKNDTHPNSITINGTEYSTVVIGSQTWTSVNYNGAGGINYNSDTNVPADGKLYTIAEAQAVKLPNGWRVPSREDFNKLLVSIGAIYQDQVTGNYYVNGDLSRKLMSTTGWNETQGTNETGFNARPAGIYGGLPDFPTGGAGLGAYFLVTLQPGHDLLQTFLITPQNATLVYTVSNATARQSLRFVKDN